MITKTELMQFNEVMIELKELIEYRFFKWQEVKNKKYVDKTDEWFITRINDTDVIITHLVNQWKGYDLERTHIPLHILLCSDEEFQQKINDIISERNKQAVEKKAKVDRIRANNDLIEYRELKKKFESDYAKEQLEFCNRLYRYYEVTQDNSIFVNGDYRPFLKSVNKKFILDLDKIYYLKNEQSTLIYEGIHRDQTIEIKLPVSRMLNAGIN